jgi:hypothetical protein
MLKPKIYYLWQIPRMCLPITTWVPSDGQGGLQVGGHSAGYVGLQGGGHGDGLGGVTVDGCHGGGKR